MYILVSGTIRTFGRPDDATEANKRADEREKEYLKIMHYLLNAEVK